MTNTKLSQRAVLVSLNRRVWQANTVDNAISAEVEQSKKAAHGSMKVVKELVAKEFLAPIRAIANLGYVEHCKLTVPGIVRGQNILAAELMDVYMEAQKEVKDAFIKNVRDFVDLYPKILEQAPKRLRGAFKAEDFPHPSKVHTYFDYGFHFMPVPEIHDWRVTGVNAHEQDAIKEKMEEQLKATFHEANMEVYRRAKEVLTKIVDQSKNYAGGPGASLLRDATIEHVKEVAGLIPAMNILGDPRLDEIGQEMVKTFSNLQGGDLRGNETVRNSVAEAAARILAKVRKVSSD